MKNLKLFFVLYFLLSTFLCGCATTPSGYVPALEKKVTIDGAAYICAKSLAQSYNLDYHWDPITKKITLGKDDKEARMMVGSYLALLNNKARTMDKEARFHQGLPYIPQSFTRKTLAPFFREKYIERKPVTKAVLPIRSVIIDAGHGGKDPGAVGRAGLKEKDVTLDIAKKLKRKLNAAGIKVIMTRESDRFISLYQRNRIANSNNTDFFISIHANASRSRWVSGVEVFYLAETIDDCLRSYNASRNYNLRLKERYSGKNTATILWDLIFSEDRKKSIELAKSVCYSLSRSLSQRNRGAKQARFYVLKANIPAILVEAGFISNVREEKRLRSPSYRDKIAQAIAEGIAQYNRSFTQRRTVRY